MTNAVRRIGPIRSCVNVVLTVVIFVLVGPFVGALAWFCLAALLSGQGVGSGVIGFVFSLLIALPALYFAGGPAAAFSGAIIVVSSNWIVQPRWLYALAAVAGAVLSVACFYSVLPLTRALIATRGIGDFVGHHMRDIAALAVIGAVAAVICTRLTRRLRLSTIMRGV